MLIKDGRVVVPGVEEPERVDIRAQDGKIIEIGRDLESHGGHDEVLDASGLLVVPGGIDPHVHFDDPGYTEREDFLHGSMAAARGGITTVIDMPCTSDPPITSKKNLLNKLDAVKDKSVVDFGFYGGVSGQSFEEGFAKNMKELKDLVLGFKTYFVSGMDTFQSLSHEQFRDVLRAAKKLGSPVLLHAEDESCVRTMTEVAKGKGKTPECYYNSRPEEAEIKAVRDAVGIANSVGGDLHIVHIGTAGAADLLKGVAGVTGETAPHYLEFDLNDFERLGPALKVTPPVKSSGNKELLWKLLAEGVIRFVASDHAPCPPWEKKTGSIWSDYSGIPGTVTLLPYMFSEGCLRDRISLRRFVEVTSEAAAKRYGIFSRKGSIEVGKDADVVLIDPLGSWVIDGERLYSKGTITPFQGNVFKGRVVKTILRGKVIYDYKQGILTDPGYGKFVTRTSL